MLTNSFLLAGVLAAISAPALAQDVVSGQVYFKSSCAGCHTVSPNLKNGAGPNLFGVVGRKVGGALNYNYSDALTKENAKGKVWSEAGLSTFLTNPSTAMPGTTMPVSIASKTDRDNLVAYLASLKTQSNASKHATSPAAPTPAKPAKVLPNARAKPVASAGESWHDDAPGKTHHIVFANLPAAQSQPSASNNPRVVSPSLEFLPAVPSGFKVTRYASDPDRGRFILEAPNGDALLSEPSTGKIKLIRPVAGGEMANISVFADNLDKPFGMAFFPSAENPQFLYVANVNSIVRFPYHLGDTVVSGPAEMVVDGLTSAPGNHTSRSIVFSADSSRLLVSIGSATNVGDTMPVQPPLSIASWDVQHGLGAAWGDETNRAAVLSFDPKGQDQRTYATGLRNCVGLMIYPATGGLMCSVNERDELGDDVPPDFVTRVKGGAFFGWPWYYIGAHEDPRLKGFRRDLKTKVVVPDLLLQAHSAPLGMAAYVVAANAPHAFPAAYRGDIFLALHGSWNRAGRTGSKVIRVLMKDGRPTGEYQDFMTGFVLNNGAVSGRPSSVAVAPDGALLINDDGTGTIWRIVPVTLP